MGRKKSDRPKACINVTVDVETKERLLAMAQAYHISATAMVSQLIWQYEFKEPGRKSAGDGGMVHATGICS